MARAMRKAQLRAQLVCEAIKSPQRFTKSLVWLYTCCRCNGNGRCYNCSCRKLGKPCVNCLPLRKGRCQNSLAVRHAPVTSAVIRASRGSVPLVPTPPGPTTSHSTLISGSTPPSIPVTSSAPQDVHSSGSNSPEVSDSPTLSFCESLPPIHVIFKIQTSTLHHVPKGARDAWAEVVSEGFRAICSNRPDIDSWCKLFSVDYNRAKLFSADYNRAKDLIDEMDWDS